MRSKNVTNSDDPNPPQVSFAIACYNAQPYLEEAIKSALSQHGVTVEIIVVDDGSSDGSLDKALQMAKDDARIKVLRTPQNGGPALARNVALKAMSGEWYAILDSDDLIHPDRSRTLIEIANKENADLIADNLRVFGESIEAHNFFNDDVLSSVRRLGIDEYFHRSKLFGSSPGPGFLKPMIRRDLILKEKLRYNEDLRIGEDDELIVRILAAGYAYALVPDAMYSYRKHDNSISHRLSLENAENMMAAESKLKDLIGPELARSRAYQGRWKALTRGLAFVKSVEHLKHRRVFSAIWPIIRNPYAALHYSMPLKAKISRRLGSKK